MKKLDLEKHKNKRLIGSGLQNLGNTCFLNSCVQILNHTYELVDLLNTEKIKRSMKKDLPDTEVITQWLELREFMFLTEGICSPNRFVYKIHEIAKEKNREIFTGFAQNDISEFLLFMIECIHNSISHGVTVKINGKKKNKLDDLAIECYTMMKKTYSKDYSPIMDLFYAIYVSQITSIDEKIVYSNTPELFFLLDLPIPNKANISIYDCFNLYTNSEILENDNAWMNNKTGKKENVKKRIFFWNFPNILVISLKRFSDNGQHKRNDLIDFPIDFLDLSKYVKGYNPESYKYELYGICNHFGSVSGGHYTSFVKNAINNWIEYNDSIINKIDNNQLITPMAYCLFYRKKNNLL